MERPHSSNPRWDEEVCERLVAGDEAALGELYDEFSPLVYGLAARVTRDWAAVAATLLRAATTLGCD